ncbi:MAG: TRAP transporter small permease subunit [Polaromonas sp.]
MSPAAPFDPPIPLTPAAPGAVTTSQATSLKDRIETILAMVFGGIFIVFAFVVSIETLCRKLFNFSLQGADELGGYALAVGSTIAFSLALMGRCHIRVDVFHERFSRRWQALLNWLSIVWLALFGLFIVYVAFKVLADTLEYGSTAQTPWATPLIWPQSVWYVGLVVFALVASGYAIRASWLLVGGQIDALLKDFSPKSAKDELKEELDDLSQRQATTGVSS